jgi:hypothetical protein
VKENAVDILLILLHVIIPGGGRASDPVSENVNKKPNIEVKRRQV